MLDQRNMIYIENKHPFEHGLSTSSAWTIVNGDFYDYFVEN